MSVELAELRAFATLASELHFGKTAEKLFMSQPALSRQIKRLEEKTGAVLFTRTRRKVGLTEAGRVLLPRALQIVQDSSEALKRARETAQGKAGTLRIGFGIASVWDILPRAIMKFRVAFPEVELHLRDMSTPSQISALLKGEIDLGIVRMPIAQPELEGVRLFQERLVLATARRFAYRSREGLSCVSNAPFIMLAKSVSTTFHEHALIVCRGAGFAPQVVLEAGEVFTILNLVRAGLGVSLVPRSAMRMNVPGVTFHELKVPQATWEIGCAWKRSAEKGVLISRFCDTLKKLAERNAG